METTTTTHSSKAVTFDQAIKICFTKFATFEGLASRSEFWWWTLFTFLVSVALNFVGWPFFGGDGSFSTTLLQNAWSLIVLVPSLAVAVRRFRDAGYSWVHIFWMFLPIIGWIILIVLWTAPSKHSSK